MIAALFLLIPNSLFILGVFYLCTHDGLIGKYLSQKYTNLTKPFYKCTPCMSSVYGSLFYLSFLIYQYTRIELTDVVFMAFMMPIYLICLCGLMFLLCSLIDKQDYSDHILNLTNTLDERL